MTKVAVIIERADISLGGAERSVLELTAELSALGVQATLIASTGTANMPNMHILCPNGNSKRIPFSRFR